jgi:hypothetical protein
MFSVITNIYNKKTEEPTLIELFTATGKLKKFFYTYIGTMCAPRVTRHTSIRYSSSCHTRVNMGASIFFTAAMICACEVTWQWWDVRLYLLVCRLLVLPVISYGARCLYGATNSFRIHIFCPELEVMFCSFAISVFYLFHLRVAITGCSRRLSKWTNSVYNCNIISLLFVSNVFRILGWHTE